MMTSIDRLMIINKRRMKSNSIKCDRCGKKEKCVSLKCVLVFLFSFLINLQNSFSYVTDSHLKEISNLYKVSGKIIDSETLKPIPFVALHIDKINRYTITDANGEFIFNNLPKGEYEIDISRLGYKERNINIVLKEKPNLTLSIKDLQIQTKISNKEKIILKQSWLNEIGFDNDSLPEVKLIIPGNPLTPLNNHGQQKKKIYI